MAAETQAPPSFIARSLRAVAGGVLGLLPAEAPMWIYKTILKPKPLRSAAHAVLRRIIPAVLTLPEGRLLLNPDDPIVSGALALGSYEPGSVACWRQLLKPDSNVLDIGANIGLYTVVAAGHARGGRIVAFEPGAENAKLVAATITENKFGNVTLVQRAVGASTGQGNLNLDPNNKGQHSLLAFDGATGTQAVSIVPVDDVVDELKLGPVHLIKMDIEGWEAQALKGMTRLLRRDHPAILFEFMPQWISNAGDDPRQMLADLRALGYELSTVDEGDGRRAPMGDVEQFMTRFRERDDYVNLLATASTRN